MGTTSEQGRASRGSALKGEPGLPEPHRRNITRTIITACAVVTSVIAAAGAAAAPPSAAAAAPEHRPAILTVDAGTATPGSYTGTDSQGWSLAFYVSDNSQQVQDVSVNHVALSCSNGTTSSDNDFTIAQATIATGGTFTATSTEQAILGGVPATISYALSGQFQGQSVAGQVSETITLTSGAEYTCTSNKLSWSAAYGSQGSQVPAAPQPGSYTGTDSQGWSLAFYVSGNSQQVQDVSVNHVALSCSNGTTSSDNNFEIPSMAITSAGAFTGTSTKTTADEAVTYTLSGHFHGLNTSGATRAAGQLVERVAFITGTTYVCTSDDLSWTAAV